MKSLMLSANLLHFKYFSSVFKVKWRRTWHEHAGESIAMPHPKDVFKLTELKPPNGSSNSVGHVRFSYWSIPHIFVHLQRDS